MKKVFFEKVGKPEEILQIQEVAIAEPKAGEVRIRVHYSPINPSDVMFVQGLYGIRPILPSGAGFEGSGIIDQVGEGVNFPIGMKVSFVDIGVWAEYICISAKAVLPLPEKMSLEVGAQAFVNPFTAWAMLHESGLKAGEWLLLTAGGSSFAQLVIQLAKEKGIKTIATVRRNDQIEQLRNLGANEVVNTSEIYLPKAVKQITEGKGVKYCFDALGGETGGQVIECLAVGGTMQVFGMLSLQNTPIHNGLVLFKNLTIKGFWLSTWITQISKETRNLLVPEVMKLLSKESNITIDGIYPIEDVIKAIQHSESEGRKGKILLKMIK
ncbi:MAG: alcohol dehydrogenase [Bacteroidetes bacterium]|nr:MAG: alcohol dehydrogenase [Bacteroidota bacterium]